MKEVINVSLCGEGTRKSRLMAEYVYCDHTEHCSAYKENKCFRVATFLSPYCEFGRVARVDGGVKHSKMYNSLMEKVRADSNYYRLSYPNHLFFTKVDDKMFLTMPHVRIEPLENGNISLETSFGRCGCVLENKHITPENFIKIIKFEPRGFFNNNVIEGYFEKDAPMLLLQIKEYIPELYQKIIELEPELEFIKPDYIDERAKLSTCNREMTYFYNENEFHFEGDYLVCNNYRSVFLPFDSKEVEIKIKVTDDMYIRITDNKQVTDDTIFK